MKCPACGCEETLVIDTRKRILKDGTDTLYRRRRCRKCNFRFTTYEMYGKEEIEMLERLKGRNE